MKTIGLIFAICFTSVQLFASQLIFNGVSNKPFKVVIDGMNYPSYNGQVKITNVSAGYHALKIVSNENNHGQTNKIVTKTSVNVPAQAIVFYDVYRNNTIAHNHTEVKQNNRYTPQPTSRTAHSNCKTPAPTSRTTYHAPVTKTCTPYTYSAAMNQYEFNRLYDRIAHLSFNSDKADAAKNAIRYNNFTSLQVNALVSLFSFESYKLEIAKLAFDKTIDPENYDMVFNQLTFSSSKRELDNYIANAHSHNYYDNRTYYSYVR